MKLNRATYCPDCEEVFERAKPPSTTNGSCPSCANRSVTPLHMILFERQHKEKEVRP